VTAVVALGGNALMRPGERGTAAEQRANLREACAALRPLLGEERSRDEPACVGPARSGRRVLAVAHASLDQAHLRL